MNPVMTIAAATVAATVAAARVAGTAAARTTDGTTRTGKSSNSSSSVAGRRGGRTAHRFFRLRGDRVQDGK